jgi:hypothetical protein
MKIPQLLGSEAVINASVCVMPRPSSPRYDTALLSLALSPGAVPLARASWRDTPKFELTENETLQAVCLRIAGT